MRLLPLAVLTLIVPALGIAGLWLAQLTWMTMRATVNGLRWRSRRWTVHLLDRIPRLAVDRRLSRDINATSTGRGG